MITRNLYNGYLITVIDEEVGEDRYQSVSVAHVLERAVLAVTTIVDVSAQDPFLAHTIAAALCAWIHENGEEGEVGLLRIASAIDPLLLRIGQYDNEDIVTDRSIDRLEDSDPLGSRDAR